MYRHELTPTEHVTLLELLQDVEGQVILSGYQHPTYDDALTKWWRITPPTTRAASGAARQEILWTNRPPHKTGGDGMLFT